MSGGCLLVALRMGSRHSSLFPLCSPCYRETLGPRAPQGPQEQREHRSVGLLKGHAPVLLIPLVNLSVRRRGVQCKGIMALRSDLMFKVSPWH